MRQARYRKNFSKSCVIEGEAKNVQPGDLARSLSEVTPDDVAGIDEWLRTHFPAKTYREIVGVFIAQTGWKTQDFIDSPEFQKRQQERRAAARL